jgi:hypothetical protein
MVSEQHRAIMEEDPMLSINIKTVQQCICPCIKECKVRECICPVCTGHRYLLEGWEEMRNEARKSETCDCLQCAIGSPSHHRRVHLPIEALQPAVKCLIQILKTQVMV